MNRALWIGLIVGQVPILILLVTRVDVLGSAGLDPEGSQLASALAVEYSLGKFDLENVFYPHRRVRVDFEVVATLDADQEEEFKLAFDRRQFRLHEGIALMVRNSNPVDLAEGDLDTLRRQIKGVVREVLGSHSNPVRDIVIPEFRVFDRS